MDGRRFLLICQSVVAKNIERLSAMFSHCAKKAKGISRVQWTLSSILAGLLLLTSCNPASLFCGSARPAPVASSLSASTVTYTQIQQGYLLTVNGSHFVAASVMIINGTTLSTTVVSSEAVQAEIPTNLISGPGTATVTVNTPGGTSGDAGCTSGGTSSALTLTIT